MSIEIEVYSEFGVPFRMENNLVVWEPEAGQSIPDENLVVKKIAEYNAKQYQRDRLQEYPSIQELVVALYDEEDKQAIIEKRNAVKAKYPKPE